MILCLIEVNIRDNPTYMFPIQFLLFSFPTSFSARLLSLSLSDRDLVYTVGMGWPGTLHAPPFQYVDSQTGKACLHSRTRPACAVLSSPGGVKVVFFSHVPTANASRGLTANSRGVIPVKLFGLNCLFNFEGQNNNKILMLNQVITQTYIFLVHVW